MTKEEIVLFYSAVVILVLIVFSILIYFKNKAIRALRLKIEELDAIYFDEIKALEDIIEKDKLIILITHDIRALNKDVTILELKEGKLYDCN